MEGCELGCGKLFQETLTGMSAGHCLVTEFPEAWVVSPSLKHSLIPETHNHDFQWGRLYSYFPNKNVCIFKSVENTKGVWLKAVYWEYNTNTFSSEILLKSEPLPCGFLSLSLMVITWSQNFGLLCPRRHLTFSMLDCRSLFPLRYYELHFHIRFPWPQEPTIQTNFT